MFLSRYSLPALVILILVNASSSFFAIPALLEKYGIADPDQQRFIGPLNILLSAVVAGYTLFACAAYDKSATLVVILAVFLLVDTAISTHVRRSCARARQQ